MSGMIFASPTNQATVAGSERTYADRLAHQLTFAALNFATLRPDDSARWRELLPANHYLQTSPDQHFIEHLQTWWRVNMGDACLRIAGQQLNPWTVSLNTAWALGADPVRLLVRLHAQCELYCFVRGPDRRWLAEIIATGRASGVMRAAAGWEAVIELLHEEKRTPVVISFSGGSSFPSSEHAQLPEWLNHQRQAIETEADEIAYEQRFETWWYDEISPAERWHRSLGQLDHWEKHGRLRLQPADWATYHFGPGINAFRLQQLLQDTPAN